MTAAEEIRRAVVELRRAERRLKNARAGRAVRYVANAIRSALAHAKGTEGPTDVETETGAEGAGPKERE